MLKRALLPLLTMSTLVTACAAHEPHRVIDGRFDDWTNTPVLVDPVDADDTSPVDIREIYATSDRDYVYLRMNLTREVNLQHLDGNLHLAIDADGDPETGRSAFGVAGAEVVVQFTPPATRRNRQSGMGVSVLSTTYMPRPDDPNARELNGYDLGVVFAPTYAGTEFEVRLERGVQLPRTAPILQGDHATARLQFNRASGQVLDETDAFRIDLRDGDTATERTDDPLARSEGAFRVMSWNGERGALFRESEVFARVMKAINPDIVLLQELSSRSTPRELETFFNTALPAGTDREWTGQGGGNLRTAVVTRLPITGIEVLDRVPYESTPDRTLRLVGGIVEVDGRRLLVASTHWKCCGSIHSREDERRMEEARIMNEVMKEVARRSNVAGIVAGGDLNLVGSRTPMDMLGEGLDLDRSTLAVAETLQVDGRDYVTWSDRHQPFVPGRLDYMLYSDSTLKAVRSFGLDTADLQETWRQVHQLELLDTERASDHFPIVVDLEWSR